MERTWILVADAARARLFTAERPRGPLTELSDFANPIERLHEGDMHSDDRGRTSTPGGGRHAFGDDKDPKGQYARRFARELADHLKDKHSHGEFKRLYLVADPKFLGELRDHINGPTERCVVNAIDKDISHLDPSEIRRHLPDRL